MGFRGCGLSPESERKEGGVGGRGGVHQLRGDSEVEGRALVHPEHIHLVQGSGFRVQGSGFRVQGEGFRVQGAGCRVTLCETVKLCESDVEYPPLQPSPPSLRNDTCFRVWDSGFRV